MNATAAEFSKGRILFATNFFAPKNEIASVRATNLASELGSRGWSIDVLTVGANVANPLERSLDYYLPGPYPESLHVRLFRPSSILRGAYAIRGAVHSWSQRSEICRGHAFSRITDTAPNTRVARNRSSIPSQAVSGMQNFVMARKDFLQRRAFSKNAPRGEDYHIVWVTYGPRHMLEVGLDLAALWPNAKFVVDIRDPIVRQNDRISLREQRDAMERELVLQERADAFTVVDPDLLYGRESLKKPVATITNGFEKHLASLPGGPGDGSPTGPLRVYYGGRLYPDQVLDSFILAALRVNASHGIRIDYAGPDSENFLARFARHGAAHLVKDHGLVTRDASIAMARQSDVALVLSWNTRERGIMTGKVFELIAIDVPLAVVVAGDYGSSVLARTFRDDPLRRVFAAGPDPRSVSAITDYLTGLRQISPDVRSQFHGPSRYERFAYPTIARKLDGFFGELVG